MGTVKQKRTAEQIRLILSDLVRLEMSDPRVQGVTITGVDIDRELQHADIHLNALGDESRREEVLEGFDKGSSYLRRELANRLRLRKVPQLHFHWDFSLQNAIEINAILDDLDIPPPDDEPAAESE